MKKGIWRKDETDYLIKNYCNKEGRELSEALNRNMESIYYKAYALGLKKDKALIAEVARRNSNMSTHGGIKFRFKKGDIPRNKGKVWSEFLSQEGIKRCRKTQFKKGQIPHNLKPLGYERVNKHGIIEVKTEKGFEAKQRVIWKKHYGKIPKGSNVIFADGNNRNMDISNLRCISNCELMERNTILRYPVELQRSIKLRSRLEKEVVKIDKKQRRENEQTNVG